MWRWLQAYGVGAAGIYLSILAALLAWVLAEGDALVIAVGMLAVPAAGASAYLDGALRPYSGIARAERLIGWFLMVFGLYPLVSFLFLAGPLVLFALPAAVHPGPRPVSVRSA